MWQSLHYFNTLAFIKQIILSLELCNFNFQYRGILWRTMYSNKPKYYVLLTSTLIKMANSDLYYLKYYNYII